jgi:hypothetical protein
VSDALQLQRVAVARSIERRPISSSRACFLFVCATLLAAAGNCLAQDAADKNNPRLQELVIHGKRQADEQVNQQVEQRLAKDPWIYAEHLTVTTHDGVVRVEGIVQDTEEWFRILDLARKTPGARRVDTSGLEMLHNDPDGG